ncbi:MAG: methyltransferase regulatory domain-containing protein [Solirubrobacteraceae bacterium]
MPGAYDNLAYPGYAYPRTHPGQLEALARLFGLEPAAAASARVLELGCGDGVNALAIAQSLPAARVVGVDRVASPIQRGRAQRGTAGLDNIELLVGDLSDPTLADRLGGFDYVIAHGVFSWVPPAVRTALLELIGRVLAPQGVGYVSYNAYPGSHLRDMARDVLEFHLRGVSGAAKRLARAHELMRAIVAIETPSPYARVLREQLQRMLDASDALLYHDELAEVSTPFYFHEFMELAGRCGLQFLSEAELSDSQMRDVPEAVGDVMAGLPADVVVREQYLDFFRNRMFRQTLLVHDELEISRRLDDAVIERLWISSPAQRTDAGFAVASGGSVETSDPLLLAALSELCDAYPSALAFDELVRRTLTRCGQQCGPSEHLRERLRELLLEISLVHIVRLDGASRPLAGQAGPKPKASPLARTQAAAGLAVLSTLLPTNHAPADATERQLIGLADGTRTRAELAEQLALDEPSLAARLEQLARAGLLLA